MQVSDIPYKYICREKIGDCLCSREQMKTCPSCKRIVDEDKLIKIIKKNSKSPYKGYGQPKNGW